MRGALGGVLSQDHGRPRTRGELSLGEADDAVEDLKIRFGHNLNRARRQLKLSLREFAARTEVSTRQIQEIEAGRLNATLATAARFAVALERAPRHMFVKVELSPVEMIRRRQQLPGVARSD